MSLPTSEPLPPADDSAPKQPPRRRNRRMVIPSGSGAQAAFLQDLAHRVTPSFDFFLFTLLAGLALVIAIVIDSPAFFVLTALLSPFMAPVVGLSFATVLGSGRFALRMLGGIFTGGLIIFGWGAVGGLVTRIWPELAYRQIALHAAFSWPDVVVLVLGASLTAYALVRSPQQRPLVTSVAIAYELYLPIGAAGFGLASGQTQLWPAGLLLFFFHLAVAALTGAVVLVLLGLKPVSRAGYALGGLMAAAALAALLLTFNLGRASSASSSSAISSPAATPPQAAQVALPTSPQPSATLTPPPSRPTQMQTATPGPTGTAAPTSTAAPSHTPTNTLVPTRTPTITFTPIPTPIWAFISASQGGGALIRREPGFDKPLVRTLLNGLLVEVLPESVQADGVTWVKIRTAKGDTEGWIVRSLLTTATPEPVW